MLNCLPEIPTATYKLGRIANPVWPTWCSWCPSGVSNRAGHAVVACKCGGEIFYDSQFSDLSYHVRPIPRSASGGYRPSTRNRFDLYFTSQINTLRIRLQFAVTGCWYELNWHQGDYFDGAIYREPNISLSRNPSDREPLTRFRQCVYPETNPALQAYGQSSC